MKKTILLLLVAVCAFVACDSVHEDISNGGHITVDELIAMSTVTVDKAPNGKNGNVITCSTSAPVNAKWNFDGKELIGNYAQKKMKVKWDANGHYVTTPYTIVLTAVCPDGTQLKAEFPVTCEDITNPLVRYYIFGDPDRSEDEKADDPQLPFQPGYWSGADMRFSSTEGAHFPTIADEVYFGLKTLIIDVSGAEGSVIQVRNGWWSSTYYDAINLHDGANELPITQQMADECAKGGEGRDLLLILTGGPAPTVNSVYYEE